MEQKTLIIMGAFALVLITALAYFSMTTGISGPSIGRFIVNNTEVTEVASPFAVDAWGGLGWDSCSTMSGGVTSANSFCICKGYTGVYNNGTAACYKENSISRWKWVVNIPSNQSACASKSNTTGSGYATTMIKCYKVLTIPPPTPTCYDKYYCNNKTIMHTLSNCTNITTATCSGTSYCLNGQSICQVNSSNQTPTVFTLTTPFAIDAWGYTGWDSCSTMSGGVTSANSFCICKGYTSVYNNGTAACYKINTASRWSWTITNATLGCAQNVSATGSGYATTQIKCI